MTGVEKVTGLMTVVLARGGLVAGRNCLKGSKLVEEKKPVKDKKCYHCKTNNCTNKRQLRRDRATQLMDARRLS